MVASHATPPQQGCGKGDDAVTIKFVRNLWNTTEILEVRICSSFNMIPPTLIKQRMKSCGQVLEKQRKSGRGVRPSDRLLPILSFVFILLTLPNLADLVIQVVKEVGC